MIFAIIVIILTSNSIINIVYAPPGPRPERFMSPFGHSEGPSSLSSQSKDPALTDAFRKEIPSSLHKDLSKDFLDNRYPPIKQKLTEALNDLRSPSNTDFLEDSPFQEVLDTSFLSSLSSDTSTKGEINHLEEDGYKNDEISIGKSVIDPKDKVVATKYVYDFLQLSYKSLIDYVGKVPDLLLGLLLNVVVIH
jgi:hypothetical protein